MRSRKLSPGCPPGMTRCAVSAVFVVLVRLTKIYRQGEGSSILTLAISIREGWKASRAEIESDVTIGEVSCLKPMRLLRHLLRADRVITGTNNTRREINRQTLNALGLGPYPTGHQDEKLVCLQNHADAGLFNGTPVRLTGAALDKSGKGQLTARIERDDGGDIWTDCGEHAICLGHFDATAGGWTVPQARIAHGVGDLHIDENGLRARLGIRHNMSQSARERMARRPGRL